MDSPPALLQRALSLPPELPVGTIPLGQSVGPCGQPRLTLNPVFKPPSNHGVTMQKLLTIVLSIAVGFVLALFVLQPGPVALGGAEEKCAARNGDVNADGRIDLSDATTVLGNLFLGNPTTLAPLCAPTAGLPATGQTGCWSFDPNQGSWNPIPCRDADCVGQDGALLAGCPSEGRFEDNDDGTVTDTCTGLMWQKNTADLNNDEQIEILGDTSAWCDAASYCDALSFAGHEDWRLPNARELQSIVDYGRSNPSIDPVFGGLSEFYWSSTSYQEAPDDAWGVGFNSGYVGIRVKLGDFDFSYNYVRAVRGGM